MFNKVFWQYRLNPNPNLIGNIDAQNGVQGIRIHPFRVRLPIAATCVKPIFFLLQNVHEFVAWQTIQFSYSNVSHRLYELIALCFLLQAVRDCESDFTLEGPGLWVGALSGQVLRG